MAENPEIDDCVTMAQFNELKRSMEEKQDQLSQDLQALMAQLRNLNNTPEVASNHEAIDEEVAAQLARQQQQHQRQAAAHARRPAVQGRGNGGNGAVRGRGRGFGDRRSEHDDSDEGDEEDYLEQHQDDGNWHRGRHARNRQNEERFGKLKFTMPKFDGGSDPEAYLTWELKVDKIFRLHNYSEEKKMAMAALEFDDYALI
jgi:hypothetical protein